MSSDKSADTAEKAGPLDDPTGFDRPMCPVGDCRFILENQSADGFPGLSDGEWWCPNHGAVLENAEGYQRRCAHCDELTTVLPEEYHGRYTTPDGEAYFAYSGTFMHPECAEIVIEAIESGSKPVTLGDFS